MTLPTNCSNKFFKTPNSLLKYYGPAIGPFGIAIICALRLHAFGNKTECYPSIETLCRLTGTTKTTVHKHLKNLQALELIRITPRKTQSGPNRSNNYALLQPQVPVPEHLLGYFPKEARARLMQLDDQPSATSSPQTRHMSATQAPLSDRPSEIPSNPKIDPPPAKSNTQIVQQVATNKTPKENEGNQTNKKTAVVIDQEFLKMASEGITKIFPALEDMQTRTLGRIALNKRGDNPSAALELLNEILKSATKQKEKIQNPFGWIKSGIENEYKPYFKQTFKKTNKPYVSNSCRPLNTKPVNKEQTPVPLLDI